MSAAAANKGLSKTFWVVLIIIILLILGGAGFYYFFYYKPQETVQPSQHAQGSINQQSPPGIPAASQHGSTVVINSRQVVVDGNANVPTSNQTPSMQDEQDKRKADYGLNESLDVVVRSDESIQIGDTTVPIKDLEIKLNIHRGQIADQALANNRDEMSAWGVHLVRAGENLWDIHFKLLKEYMVSRGVELRRGADQPLKDGYSSDVGKILKFAEHMVGVYNLKTGHMQHNLNLLEPGEKIVIFNLSELFSQLNQIDHHDLHGVSYDGRVLFFPNHNEKKD